MTAAFVMPPFQLFTDGSGNAVEDGFIYIGIYGLNPLDPANRLAVYWDSALSIPAAQPIRTQGGFPQFAGTPAKIFLPTFSMYSIAILDKNGLLVYSSLYEDTAAFQGDMVQVSSLEALAASFINRPFVEVMAARTGRSDGGAQLVRNGSTGVPTTPGNEFTALAANNFFNAAGIGYSLVWPQRISFETFGCIPDGNGAGGGTDNAVGLQAAATYSANKSLHGSGTYLTSKQINFGGVRIIADSEIFIDGSAIVGAPDAPDNTVLNFTGGELVQISDLSADVGIYTNVLNFSTAHGLEVGDYFCIYNPTDGSFNSRRTVYRAGEWCKVAEITSSTSIRVAGLLFASYLAASVDIYRMDNPARVYLTGRLKVFAPNISISMTAVSFRHIVESDLSNLSGLADAGVAAIAITQCVNVNGQNMVAAQWLDSGTGTQYGIAIGNSQHINVHGHFTAQRHAIQMGGGGDVGCVPNRDCNGSGFLAKNSLDNSAGAADFHGNCEWCSYDAMIVGGITLSGDKNKVRGTIIADGTGMIAYAGELLGFNFDMQGVTFVSNFASGGTVGAFDIGGNSSPLQIATTRGGTLDLQNTRWLVPGPTGQVIWVRNRGAVGTDLRVNLNDAKFIETNPAGVTGLVRIDAISGDPIDRVSFEGMDIDRDQPFVLTGSTRQVNWSDSGNAVVAVTTAVNTASVAVLFNRRFPSIPKVTTGMLTITSGGANDRCMARVTSVTVTGFTMQVYTADEANFTANANISVDWVAK